MKRQKKIELTDRIKIRSSLNPDLISHSPELIKNNSPKFVTTKIKTFELKSEMLGSKYINC